MSQEVNTSPSASEPAQPEPIAPPSKGGKKKNLLLMIVAIIVAIALISTVAVVMLLPDDDEVELTLASEITPSGTITVPAGKEVRLAVNSTLSNDDEGIEHDIDSWTNVTYRWSKDPSDLGSFDLLARRTVTFTAADSTGTGTVSCLVTYGDVNVTVEADVIVSPATLDTVSVTPSSRTVPQNEPLVLTASATDSVGATMTGVTFTWSVWNMSSDDYTLNATTGTSVTFTGLAEGQAFVNATATVATVTRTGTALVTVGELPARSVDYYFYDMFDVPFGEWWDMRWVTYGDEEPITDSYPYIYKWYGNPEGNFWWYTNMRMNLTGRNMPELNMQENPEFLPFLGTTRGGTAKIDWYMQYLTEEEMSRYPDATASWLDGWVIALNGTVTLDEEAAMAVLGVTAEGFDDFSTWWNTNNASVNQAYLDWVKYEGGRYRLDIYNMYEYPLTFMTHQIWCEKVGDEVVVHYDTVSWGMEAMITRWMHEAFMPTEWYFEDMDFHAVIGPETADLDVDTVAVYAMYAYETTLEGEPCWMWESLLQDYVASTAPHPVSDYDIYADKTYVMLSPGSPLYGDDMIYDYAPGAWNLSEGETLGLTWPSGEQLFYRHGGDNLVYEEYADMRVDYAEPMGTDFPGQVLVDQDERTITYIGPIDMWTWSKDQTEHENLASEWDRLGLLPYGMPTIEFRKAGPPEASSFEVVVAPDEVETDEPVDVTVTVYDQYGELFSDYTGTVSFESTDPLAVLPEDYTFLVADEGAKTFTGEVSFGTSGMQTVTVRDTLVDSLFGVSNEVTVAEAPYPYELEVSGVTTPILKDEPSDFTVRVLDQYGEVFPTYTGTVTFTSNDTEAVLPEPYTFTVEDAGVHVFTDGVTFGTADYHDLSASDDSAEPITGMQDMILVLELHYEATYLPALVLANETEVTLTISVMDQYDNVYEDYEGTVVIDTDDQYEVLPAPTAFTLADAGVKEVTGLMLGMPGARTVTMTDQDEPDITGEVSIVVSPMAKATYLELTGVSQTVVVDIPETVVVTVYDQYDRVFPGYDGTVHFSTTDPDVGVTLPPDTAFVPATHMGVQEFVDGIVLKTVGDQTITCEDAGDSSISGSVDVYVTDIPPEITSFIVEGIASGEWAGNESDVTVTALDQYDNILDSYVGTVTFETDATGTYELPPDTTFEIADGGVKTMSPVSFDEPGTYSVTVSDTVVTAATGTQSGIVVVERPVAASIVLSGYPTDAMAGEAVSLTVTVYDQFDDVHVWYEGTVVFSSTDGAAVFPVDCTFTLADAGVRTFDIVLNTAGAQTITVEDSVDSLVTATTDPITVAEPPSREVDINIYDMFAEPWGEWWTADVWGRNNYYADSFTFTHGAYNTMVFYPGDSSGTGSTKRYQSMVFAPYRLSLDGTNLPELDVTNPEFMPVLGSGTGVGAQVSMDVNMQYLDTTWWSDYWVSTWSGYTGWPGDTYFPQLSGAEASDGYHLGTEYSVLLNREAAELWLGMPTDADPATWWGANSAWYRTEWIDWILYEANERLPIVNAYEWEYYALYTMVDMAVEGDDIRLSIGHISWGYEVLLCRWLDDIGLFNHQPWYEDLSLSVNYGEGASNLAMDAVCQWSLHAVKANETSSDPAWAWEPLRIDYGVFDAAAPSDFEPYVGLDYQSWNAGDEMFSMDVGYDATPALLELDEGETLTFQLPTGSDVIGYEGTGVNYGTYGRLLLDDTSDFDAIQLAGSMDLGYHITDPSAPLDLSDPAYWDSGAKTLTIQGPQTFDQVRHSPDGPLYHGAPWIEFNIVVPPKALSLDEPATAPLKASAMSVVGTEAGASLVAEAMSMVAVVAAVVLAVAAMGCNVRRIQA